MRKEEKLKELKAKLKDLKSQDPSHCSGTNSFTDHSISPELFQEIENLEGEIKKLEEQDK